jgi:hypothetical protein
MTRKDISIIRIVTALLLVAGTFGLMVTAYAAGEVSGIQTQRDRQWAQEVQRSGWRPASSRMAMLAEVDAFGVLQKHEGNAAAIYWPEGIPGGPSPCARANGFAFEGPLWTNPVSRWREAAACSRVDEIVRAAHLTRMDISGLLSDADPNTLTPSGAPLFGTLHDAPLQDIAAVTARAHLRIEQGDLIRAEEDARAAVSAGLHFMRGAADTGGMLMAAMRVVAALDHLREVHARRGDVKGAEAVAGAMAIVKDVRSMLSRYESTIFKAAALTSMHGSVLAIATNQDNPVGVRASAASALGIGYLANWREVLFGPSRERRDGLDTLATEPVLAAAVAAGRQQFDLPFRKKLSVLQATWTF